MALTQGQFEQLLAALPGMIGAGQPTKTWEQHEQWDQWGSAISGLTR